MLSYGFNHAEAARSFKYAAHLDPECAMCYWGQALVLGPNINAPMDTSVVTQAYEAAQKAQQLAAKATEWEQAMISALQQRYVNDKAAPRPPLDSAYAAAMRGVYQQFPENTDIGALFAEAMMDVHPWDYWYRTGEAKPWTAEIIQTLEQTIARDSLHVGANHFYVHATEASKTPERALPSADRLMYLTPGAGHLVHMASHTYLRTGDYHKGTISNELATAADSVYMVACHAQGIYPLIYLPHNHHFLAATAGLEGNREKAIAAGFQTMKHTPSDAVRTPGLELLQQFLSVPYTVLVKFAKWDDILNLPAPKEEFPYPIAMYRYSRGMAFVGKKQLAEAEKELEALKKTETDSAMAKLTLMSYNPGATVAGIARRVLEARIAEEKGEYDKAAAILVEAVAVEDSLHYIEPPDWFYSTKHELGAVLLKAKKYAEAEKVYLSDLETYRENGWALNGLHDALVAQKKAKEAEAVKARLVEAWQYADVKLEGSRVEVRETELSMK